jgi:hypothetical protein
MADTVEMQDIRGLDIDKTVKGFGEVEYIFKNDLAISTMEGDAVRWYQKTNGDLTATAPSVIKNVSPLALPDVLEVSWTRNTSYPRKYFVRGFLSMEDIKSADVGVLAQTMRDLTRAVTKQVDTDIFNAVYDNGSVTNINVFAAATQGGEWDKGSYGGNPLKCLLYAKQLLISGGYSPEGVSAWMDPTSYTLLVDWLITGKGSSIPSFAAEKVRTGAVMNIMGVNIKPSPNITVTSGAIVIVSPQRSATWKTYQPLTARAIENPGVGTEIRVWEQGITLLTDPKSVVYISGAHA